MKIEEAPVSQEEAEAAKEKKGREPFEETDEETNEETETPEEETPEETNEEEETSETSEPEKVEKSTDRQPTAKEFKAMDGAKKHFEKENIQLKDDLVKAKAAAKPATGDPMEAVRLGKALAEYSEKEAEAITNHAKGKFNTLTPTPEQIIQASKDEWVKTAIEAEREKVAGESKTPLPSSPSSVLGETTEEELEKMDDKKFSKWFKKETKGKRVGA